MSSKATPRQNITLSGPAMTIVGGGNRNVSGLTDDSTGIASPSLAFEADPVGSLIAVSETGLYSITATFIPEIAGDICEMHQAAEITAVAVSDGTGSRLASLRASGNAVDTAPVTLNWTGEIEAGQVIWFAIEGAPQPSSLNQVTVNRLS